MYPGCRFMDFHPQQTEQMPYAPHHCPGFRYVHPQMKMDTARSPVNYESFPCYGTYGCPYPSPYRGCYPNQVPDYQTYGLHHPHYAPPPPVYCHGSYPFQYLPSPHYSTVDPRYEYEKKGLVDHHCCGCPNHLCQQKEEKNVKIEEQTSDDEKDRVASLVPPEVKDQSCPVLWIPPGYKRIEEGEQAIRPDSKRESSFDKEAKGSLKPCGQEPGVWNGWLPVDLNNLKSLVEGRGNKGTEHERNEDSKSSFPGGWMPHNPDQDKLELKDGDQKSIWGPSQYGISPPLKFIENQDKKSMPEGDTENTENFSSEDGPEPGDKNVVKKIIPVKQMDQSEPLKPFGQEPGVWNGWLPIDLNNLKFENQDKKSMPEGDTENTENFSSEDGPKPGDKNVVKKIIPVKQMDRSEEEGLLKDSQTEENQAQEVEKNHSEMHLKHTDKKGEKKHLEKNSNGQSSLSKASKLPPVCLRVDPLPSRRTKNGSSRSPSSPANKKKSEMLSRGDKSSSSSTVQANNQQDMQSSADSDVGGLQNERKVKNIEVFDSTESNNKKEACTEDLSESSFVASAADSQERVSSGCQDGKGGNSDQNFSVGDNGVKNVNKLSGEVKKDEELTFEGQSGDVKGETGANGGPIGTRESELESTNGAPCLKFSEAEAAAIIQSAYRGFAVRRWEPLKKLKEIARIKGELIKIRQDVQNLVSSGSGNVDKQRISIGEAIMNLLLQLDTMQGLHPSIRSIRKSVAKELVSLQEKLDSITFQNSDGLKEFDKSKHAEDISKRAGEEERVQPVEGSHEQETTSPIFAEEKSDHVVELQNPSPLLDSDWSVKEDEVTKVYTEVPPRVPGELELVEDSGLISLDKEAKETSAEEQQHEKLLTESPNLSDPEDNIATTVCSEGSPEPKDDISTVGDLDRDKELSADEKSIDNMLTAAAVVDTTEISDIKEVANACQFEGEGDYKPVDDMQTADNVGYEAKETPDIKAAVNVSEVEANDKPVDGVQTADTVGIEQEETPEVNEFKKDVGPVENMEFIETCGTELEDISMTTSDLQVKQQNLSFVNDEVSGEVVHMEGTANCNIEQKMAMDEDQEMWEDKIDDKEIYQKHSDGNIIKIPRDEDLVEEVLGTEKVNKQPHREFATGEEDLAGEELVTEQPQKGVPASLPILGQMSNVTETESAKKLVEENEKLREAVEKLIASGKEQLTAISSLSERVKDLEKKLSRKKKLKMRRHKSPSQYLLQV